MPTTNRRDLLKLSSASLLTGSGVTAIVGVGKMLSHRSESEQPQEIDLGPSESFELGTTTVVMEGKALLIHDETGFTALSLICTHLGCSIEQNEDGFTCPCHGSKFDKSGNPIHKPATKPLRKLFVVENDVKHLLLDNG